MVVLHLSSCLFLPSYPSTAHPQSRAKLACSPKCCIQNTRDRASTQAPCRPVHAADLWALHPSSRTPPSAPKPSRFPRPRTSCAYSSPPLPVSHTASAPQLNSCSTAPSSTPPPLQHQQTRALRVSQWAEPVTSLTIPTYPPFAHGPSFSLALRCAVWSMCALAMLTLAAFDADLDRGVNCVTFCGPGCAASAA